MTRICLSCKMLKISKNGRLETPFQNKPSLVYALLVNQKSVSETIKWEKKTARTLYGVIHIYRLPVTVAFDIVVDISSLTAVPKRQINVRIYYN